MVWGKVSELNLGYTLELAGTYSTEEDALKVAYEQLAQGLPCIYKLYNPKTGRSHWVTIYGYEAQEDSANALDMGNFLMIDPVGGTPRRLNEHYNSAYQYETFRSGDTVKGAIVVIKDGDKK
jgi:hypothetical protein